MIGGTNIDKIENAVRKVNRELEKNSFAGGWKTLSEEVLFSELASCIIGSRITYEKAKHISELLRHNELLILGYLLECPHECESKIYSLLREQGCLYAASKARYIVGSAMNIYLKENITIKQILRKASDPHIAREIISRLCPGIGLKQASLFLRNIHYSDDLAILDTHVISYMQLVGIENDERKDLNRNRYLSYENDLRSYSVKFDTTIAQLDASIWVVMRTILREFKWML